MKESTAAILFIFAGLGISILTLGVWAGLLYLLGWLTSVAFGAFGVKFSALAGLSMWLILIVFLTMVKGVFRS